MIASDALFFEALVDSTVKETVDGRIFNTFRNEEDENEDRIPYIIITHEGGQNIQECKDDVGESDTDQETIAVLCVGNNREELAELVADVREVIHKNFEDMLYDSNYPIRDYALSFSAVQADPSRPCHYQTLTYQCETLNS